MKTPVLIAILFVLSISSLKVQAKPNLRCVAAAEDAAMAAEQKEKPGEEFTVKNIDYEDGHGSGSPSAGHYLVTIERGTGTIAEWNVLLGDECQVLSVDPIEYGPGECRPPHPPGCCAPNHLCK